MQWAFHRSFHPSFRAPFSSTSVYPSEGNMPSSSDACAAGLPASDAVRNPDCASLLPNLTSPEHTWPSTVSTMDLPGEMLLLDDKALGGCPRRMPHHLSQRCPRSALPWVWPYVAPRPRRRPSRAALGVLGLGESCVTRNREGMAERFSQSEDNMVFYPTFLFFKFNLLALPAKNRIRQRFHFQKVGSTV